MQISLTSFTTSVTLVAAANGSLFSEENASFPQLLPKESSSPNADGRLSKLSSKPTDEGAACVAEFVGLNGSFSSPIAA
jgi:hypothetical protein